MTTQTLQFQAETDQLLSLMIHSVYSEKDIFLRELVSNASDALDKLRLEAYQDKDLDADVSDLHIDLIPDAQARTLTIADNGIGMTRDDVVELIGTLAKSGTGELRQKLEAAKQAKEQGASAELIGQFGIGFYSAFMVADRVTLVTRRAGENTATRWESEGHGSYTITDLTGDDVPPAHGTTITLHLRAEDDDDSLHDYTSAQVLRSIVRRYSDFIAFPIRLVTAAPEAPAEDADEAGDTGPETLNSMQALWARPKDEVTDEEYADFYRHVSHAFDEPLETIAVRAEGTFEYQALLFIPTMPPFDMFYRNTKPGPALYVKRVFIMDHCEALLPGYLRFVTGVVDAQDLSLNVSREILQNDRHLVMIRKRLVKRILQTITAMQENEREKYDTFWSSFGAVLKEGLLDDHDNRDTLLKASSFASTFSADGTTGLAEYVSRMPEGQDVIYYATGESRSQLESSPHLEAFAAKGFEVLLLTDQVDELWTPGAEFDGKRFVSVAKGEADLGDDAPQAEGFEPLTEWLAGVLEDKVSGVRLTSRLTTSPACLVGGEFDLTPQLEQMYRASGQEVPRTRRTLELNPDNDLVKSLRDRVAATENAGEDESLADAAEVLYGTAVLAEGGSVADPAEFATVLARTLARTVS
ncbi:Chaperone protein HtpG OS=Tsukamurella paurometabola (strain ATCC 8368 / DSM / CCUG 35730 /CIP 100753 / JCM 10117 / KCTC 9821 / NBRC 16120 / NCIMB 702349/ NCTC 13040) OX=521096 GN=htpG PE=3 SV=1 [Tsukamurella paurometabola]|uniref:Chaperone protein HtpG n=1 Tax=Tsukamurella paurometabola (strain ATCC 8368 / DSM 20162 / CCUG 35730 / CIP 100753 / JCM 10117 / KCTC 9821 / NBRC 16120 / NCIMB 702349 / NCTC 13040) TaxID=521096 RepID=D5UY42_TSUPD|nr:molecular chaperone HtpG [Tsukamurella paurometabola]ADG80279.1 Heat shock protein Hsp90-like protein [Tsukamurella paurometabola DSM 20162]SUP39119.1 High temperature protein G [Tsukamurella paurometabola]